MTSYDLHMELDGNARTLKLYDAEHKLLLQCEARNRTTANGQYGHDGNCPPGEFLLGAPSPRGTVPFGPFFIPILDYDGYQEMRHYGRRGIGLHGGGTGLARPMADRQGWQVTHGCWRVQNEDLQKLTGIVFSCQEKGGEVFVTVAPMLVVESNVEDDWGPAVTLAMRE